MTMKAHTNYIIFGRPPIGGKLPPSPSGGATGTYGHAAGAIVIGSVQPSPAGMYPARTGNDTTGTVPVPCAGRFRRQNMNILFK